MTRAVGLSAILARIKRNAAEIAASAPAHKPVS